MAPSNQIKLAKDFSNILVNIMKLEDRFNQFETTYLQRKFQTKNNSNLRESILTFESSFYDTFSYFFKSQGNEKLNILLKLKEILEKIKENDVNLSENKQILPKILSANTLQKINDIFPIRAKENNNWDPVFALKELLENNPAFQTLIFKVLKEIQPKSNIDIIDQKIKEINSKNSLNQLSNIDTANINILDVLISLKRTIESSTGENIFHNNKNKLFTEQDFNKILAIINTLIKHFSDYNFNEKLVRTIPVPIGEYKKNLESIRKIFVKYNKYKTKKEVENFTNLVNNMSKPIKKHFNGITITFAFVTRLLKYLVIKLINEKVSNSPSVPAVAAPAAPPAQKKKSIYNPRKIELVNDPVGGNPVQIILMRPTITKGDIFRMLSSPETYKECRAKELSKDANKISKIGEDLFDKNDYKDLFDKNDYKDFNGPIFYFEEGKSTANLFTKSVDKTQLKSRQKLNVIAEIGNKLRQQILEHQTNPQPDPQLILICEPSDIQRIFDINDFATGNSIQKMPYASGIKVKMYVEDKKFYFEKVYELETTLSINGSEKTLSPTDEGYVNNVKQWYLNNVPPIQLSCGLNIGQI